MFLVPSQKADFQSQFVVIIGFYVIEFICMIEV